MTGEKEPGAIIIPFPTPEPVDEDLVETESVGISADPRHRKVLIERFREYDDEILLHLQEGHQHAKTYAEMAIGLIAAELGRRHPDGEAS
jgi:hypothetical protein